MEEQGGGGAERAVGESFQPADVEHVAAEIGRHADVGQPLPVGERLMAGDANGERAGVEKFFIDAEHSRLGRHVLDAGDATFVGIAHGGADGGGDFLLARRGHDALGQPLRGVLQYARGFAARVANDRSSGRIIGFARNTGQLQCDAVGKRHVPVEAGNQQRMIAGDGIDKLARGEPRGRPVLVIPCAAGDPAAAGKLGGEVRDALAELVLAAGVAQLDARKIPPAGVEMDVGVVEAGHHTPAAQIDHLRPRADPLLNYGVPAHGHDARADTGHGLGLRYGEIARPDLAMNQNERGGGLGVERDSE